MNTLQIFIIICCPFQIFGQSPSDLSAYPIVAEGEKWISQSPDTACFLAQNLLSKPGLDIFSRRQAYFILGKARYKAEMSDEAIFPLQESIVLSQKNKDEKLLLWTFVVISAALGDKESPSLDSSLFYLENAQGLAEKLRDTVSLAKIYINTANVFYLNEDYKKALENNYSCESLLRNSYFEQEKALNFYSKGIILLEIYIKEGKKENLRNAQQSFQTAIKLFNKLGNKSYEADSRNALAGSFLYSENLDEASLEVKQSIKLGIQLNNPEILLNGYYTLSVLCEMQNNLEGSIDALKKLGNYILL